VRRARMCFFGKSGEQWFRDERQHVEFVSTNGQGEYRYVDYCRLGGVREERV